MMPNAYWNAHSDRDWEDGCGMYEEPQEVEEEPDLDEIEALARVWSRVFDRVFPLSRWERALLNWETDNV